MERKGRLALQQTFSHTLAKSVNDSDRKHRVARKSAGGNAKRGVRRGAAELEVFHRDVIEKGEVAQFQKK